MSASKRHAPSVSRPDPRPRVAHAPFATRTSPLDCLDACPPFASRSIAAFSCFSCASSSSRQSFARPRNPAHHLVSRPLPRHSSPSRARIRTLTENSLIIAPSSTSARAGRRDPSRASPGTSASSSRGSTRDCSPTRHHPHRPLGVSPIDASLEVRPHPETGDANERRDRCARSTRPESRCDDRARAVTRGTGAGDRR